MVAGDAFEAGVVSVVPAAGDGSRGSSQPVRLAVAAETVAEAQCLPCEFVGPRLLKVRGAFSKLGLQLAS